MLTFVQIAEQRYGNIQKKMSKLLGVKLWGYLIKKQMNKKQLLKK